MSRHPSDHGTDLILLVEVGLVLVLIGLFVALYLIPARDGTLAPEWWVWPLLAALFFGILLLERWRTNPERRRPEPLEELDEQS